MIYNEYLYIQLVNDLLINGNGWVIPYDLSYPLVKSSYEDFNTTEDVDVAMYEQMHNYINDDETLYTSLRELNEK